jgi:hypothetical protein
MPAPVSMVLEAPFVNHLRPKSFNDLLEMPIGEADPLYLDNQEDLSYACMESTCKESCEDSGEDDYIDEENDCTLEEMIVPSKMFHSIHSLHTQRRPMHKNDAQEGHRSLQLHFDDGVGHKLGHKNGGGVDVNAGRHESACGDNEEPFNDSRQRLWK